MAKTRNRRVMVVHGHPIHVTCTVTPMGTAARDRLAHLLAGDQAAGSDTAMLRLPGDALKLHVADVGPVTLPVRAAQAKRLIAVARPALFGHGEETLSDSSVRDTWEISPAQVTLGGASWEAHLNAALALFRDELGLTAGSRRPRRRARRRADRGPAPRPHWRPAVLLAG